MWGATSPFSTATGALVHTFAPAVSDRVHAIAATAQTVYAGGSFTSVGGIPRSRLAAFGSSNGALLNWAPAADDNEVDAMVLSPMGKVIVGGKFSTLSGTPAKGSGALDPTSGAVLPWAANNTVQDSGANSGITSLRSDGHQIYGTGFVYGPGGNLEGTFSADPETGAINWVEDCHGDTYDTFATGQTFYSVSHSHFCGNVGGFPQTNPWSFYRALAWTNYATGTLAHNTMGGYKDWGGTPSPTQLDWYPTLATGKYTGQNQAAWSVTGNSQYVALGGEFPTVNGTAQQGLVRFAVRAIAPNKAGPRPSPTLNPSLVSLSSGTVRVGWQATFDQDNQALTYKVVRDGKTATPVYTATVNSTFWNRPTLGFTDTGLVPGSSHTYRVYVSDPTGNQTTGSTVTVTVGAATNSTYANDVLSDGATNFWRLGEVAGTTGYDWAGYNDLVEQTGVGHGAAGAINGDSNGASTFTGSSAGSAANTAAAPGPNAFTIEAWFKTTSTSGGKIIGYGDTSTGTSSNYDRQIYLDNAGHVIFGVYNGATNVISTGGTYRDGAYHQVVASLSPAGMALYVDGKQVGTKSGPTVGQGYSGYWRIGGDNLAGWPSQPASNFLAGSIDDVAVYSTPLSLGQIQKHYTDSGSTLAGGTQPVAAFSSSCTNLSCTFDGSGSTDSNGAITSYAWNFGDGTTGTGVPPTHTYAASGTYTVSLTISDNSGFQSTAAKKTFFVGDQPPTAAFTASCDHVACTLDGSGSSDTDGTIASYAWNFGDGSTATGATATHTFPATGTYTVTLVVTDNQGVASAATAHPVSVLAANTPLATDSFNRTVSSGLGSADKGGPWTTVGAASNLSVAPSAASLLMPAAGGQASAYLPGVSSSAAETDVNVSVNQAPTSTGVYFYVTGRRVSANNEYRGRVRIAGNKVYASFYKLAGSSTATAIGGETLVPVSYTPGVQLSVRLQVSGTGTTNLAMKVWQAGMSEPAAWTVTNSDTTAGLQVAGSVGLTAYLAGSATNTSVILNASILRVVSL
jgi:PKD repeat protein